MIFEAPKKPKKSKFQENEKNVRRFSLKMPKPTPPAIGATQLYPKDPLETAKSAQNAIFIKQSQAKKIMLREKGKKSPEDMPMTKQNTKNQPYMTIQCLWKPVQKPEKMDYFGLKRG